MQDRSVKGSMSVSHDWIFRFDEEGDEIGVTYSHMAHIEKMQFKGTVTVFCWFCVFISLLLTPLVSDAIRVPVR
jgi:hypothetical protein